jgi:hypothetical protein
MLAETAISTSVALFGLWFAVYHLWRDYRIDAFRDEVFAIRDRLFLYAAEKNISFTDGAYVLLRARMNLMLRHGHELTLTRLVLASTYQPVSELPNPLLDWETAVTQLPEKTQKHMREVYAEFTFAVFTHVVYISFFRYMVLRPIVQVVRPFVQLRKVVQRRPPIKKAVETLETEAAQKEARQGVRLRPVTA